MSHRSQSLGEEIANSLTYGAGLVAAAIGVPILLFATAGRGDALAGVTLKAFHRLTHPVVLSAGLYLVMGWLALIAIVPLWARIAAPGLALLFGGGLAHTAGVAFFAADSRRRYAHAVWHLFVLAGSACHYLAVLYCAA